MNILSFYWPHNRILKSDGDWFEYQCESFNNYFKFSYSVESFKIPKTSKWKRRTITVDLTNKQIGMDRIAFFCHGWPKSFDAGFDVSNVHVLGEALKKVAADDCRIYLFCCKTGKLKDGLAAKLAESSGLPVFAHSTSGRAVRNPYKWLFHNGERYPLFPDPKNKELWNHHKLEVESDPFGFYERVEL